MSPAPNARHQLNPSLRLALHLKHLKASQQWMLCSRCLKGNSNMSKPTYRLDASGCSLTGCWYRYKCRCLDGLKPLSSNNDIEYGNAFAKFLEHWRRTNDFATAVAQAHLYYTKCNVTNTETKNPAKFLQACVAYADCYANDTFNVLKIGDEVLVEQTFSWPVYEDDDMILLAEGTIDVIGEQDGRVTICDDKTTGTWNKEEYLRKFEVSHQLLFYNWILTRLAHELPEKFAMFDNCPAMINGIFVTKAGATFARSNPIIEFPPRLLRLFRETLELTIRDLVKRIKNSMFLREGLVNGACRDCPYVKLCSAPDDQAEQFIRDTEFVTVKYSPMEFKA